MTSKKTPTIKQLLTEPTEAIQAQPAALRTIWNTSCGGYPAADWLSVAAGGKQAGEGGKKPARVRAKAA